LRGGGVILRAVLLPGPLRVELPAYLVGRKMTLVDLTERDLRDLGTAGATVTFDRETFGSSIATLRLR
jgi:hypothetical protein